MKAKPSSLSKASSSKSQEGTSPFQEPGFDEPWTCRNNALCRIANLKLPAAYQSVAQLEFQDERLTLLLNGQEQELKPEQGRVRRAFIRSRVRAGRVLAESAPMEWTSVDGIRVRRTIRLVHSELSHIIVSLQFEVTNEGQKTCRPTLQWHLTLPRCVPFIYHKHDGKLYPCQQGDLERRHRRDGELIFSFNARHPARENNQLLGMGFPDRTPHTVTLSTDQAGYQSVTACFTGDLTPKVKPSYAFAIDLRYEVLLRHQISDTVFLVARPEVDNAPWQGALAAAMSWIDRLEVSRDAALYSPGFRRFASFLWFDRNKPLPDQVLRFLHDMPSLQRIIVFGEVLHHDLENLLTALLDKGGGQLLRLHIFTDDEYYRDRVNVLRGNIQARMIIADESTERVRRLEEIVSVAVVPDPNLLPLALRHFMEEPSPSDLFGTSVVQDTAAFLVLANGSEARLLAAAAVPMARHLAAPVLLWSRETERETLDHLKHHQVRRVFLVGRFNQVDVTNIEASLDKTGNAATRAIVHIPYQDPVAAAATLAHLFKAHLLLDWLVRSLYAERERVNGRQKTPIADLTRQYITTIQQRPWARRLVELLDRLVEEEVMGDLLPVYQHTFIARDEFITSFQEHFIRAAEEALDQKDEELLGVLAPVWNDMAVLCDFDEKGHSHHNFYTAACFAAYHQSPLLLFPTISKKEEEFLDRQVRTLERQFLAIRSRDVRPTQATSESHQQGMTNATKSAQELARLVFPPDLQRALRSINPLSIALYSTDVRVPYEVISDQHGPISLNYVIGHLSGTDPYGTSLITASGMLYADELQRQRPWRVLICLVNLPTAPLRMLEEEGELIRKMLESPSFTVDILSTDMLTNQNSASKEDVLKELAGKVHLFHFSGHGIENPKQPQRSGILFWNAEKQAHDPLNALEVKYHTKLGAHPLVFLNGCFGGSKARIPREEKGEEDSPSSQR